MLFYSFYNAPLFDLLPSRSMIPSGFVDDTATSG
jgi:hypothetical protein